MNEEQQFSRALFLARKKQWTALETYLQQSKKAARYDDINPKDPETSLNILMMACKESKRGIIEILLDLAVDVNVQTRDGMTALHYAAASCPDIIVENLLKAGAQTTVQGGPMKQLPLHIACKRHSIALIIAKLLLKKMPKDARLVTDSSGSLPLTYAVETSNAGLVSLLLAEYAKEQAADWRDNETGNCHIHLAANKGDHKMVQILVGLGFADVNAQNKFGQTAFHIAAIKRDMTLAKMLHSLKASADIIDKVGRILFTFCSIFIAFFRMNKQHCI